VVHGGQDRRGRCQHVMARPLARGQLKFGQLLADQIGHAHHEIRSLPRAAASHPPPSWAKLTATAQTSATDTRRLRTAACAATCPHTAAGRLSVI
jgi:hypothetical protein